MYKVVEIKPLPDYRLWIRYEDGVEGEVDLSHLVGRGVFKAWEDKKVFEQVHISSSGAPSWEDDVDLCPDALYLQITGETAEHIFPKLKTTHIDA